MPDRSTPSWRAVAVGGIVAAWAGAVVAGTPASTVPTVAAHPAPSVLHGGDPDRGRAIAASRSLGLCSLCHAWSGLPTHLAGNLGPNLDGVASRLELSALIDRLRQPQRTNPETIMPSYGQPHHSASRVVPNRQGQALLDESELRDVVAWLQTLR